MENKERLSYLEYVKEFIVNNLDDWKDSKIEPQELGCKLTEAISVDGSATYSNYEAKQYLIEWFDDVGEFIEYYQNETGDAPQHNPFTECELFHLTMIIEGVDNVLNQLNLRLDEEIELTSEFIEQIKEELKEVNNFTWEE